MSEPRGVTEAALILANPRVATHGFARIVHERFAEDGNLASYSSDR